MYVYTHVIIWNIAAERVEHRTQLPDKQPETANQTPKPQHSNRQQWDVSNFNFLQCPVSENEMKKRKKNKHTKCLALPFFGGWCWGCLYWSAYWFCSEHENACMYSIALAENRIILHSFSRYLNLSRIPSISDVTVTHVWYITSHRVCSIRPPIHIQFAYTIPSKALLHKTTMRPINMSTARRVRASLRMCVYVVHREHREGFARAL